MRISWSRCIATSSVCTSSSGTTGRSSAKRPRSRSISRRSSALVFRRRAIARLAAPLPRWPGLVPALVDREHDDRATGGGGDPASAHDEVLRPAVRRLGRQLEPVERRPVAEHLLETFAQDTRVPATVRQLLERVALEPLDREAEELAEALVRPVDVERVVEDSERLLHERGRRRHGLPHATDETLVVGRD